MMPRDLIYVIPTVDEPAHDTLVGFDLISKINWLEEILAVKWHYLTEVISYF